MTRWGFLAALVTLGLVSTAGAQEKLIPHAQDKPPGPALSPEEAVRQMSVPEGFKVEVVVSEPDLVNPVSMAIDERGRFWITESLEYPRREPGPGRDRVKVLEDTDGDGKADKFSIFLEGLNIPSGIAVGHGGVWVANSPDILFIPNADGDLRPDGPPQVVVSGFGRADTHELPNSLTWGPDGWLYGWNGVFNQSHVEYRGKTYDFTCAIFRIHPKTREFEIFCEGTSNPWGLAINPEGDFFASACVIDHLWHLVESAYYLRQGGPYPPHTWPMGSIVNHLHQKRAYCGIHYFDSPAYPEEYRDRLYMGNIHGNCINVDVLEKDGSTYKAESAPDFLSANDAWFMPIVQKTGPDGCLYILDWYDQYHCYQDANRDPAGVDRLKGRLYRVRYKGTPRRFGFDLAKESDQALVDRLLDPNVYDRDIAQRLLTERLMEDKASQDTRERLRALVLEGEAPRKSRMHALWVLVGGGPLETGFHEQLLAHDDPTYRAWGVRAAGNMAKSGQLDGPVRSKVLALATDPAPEVRLQVAVAAPKMAGSPSVSTLLKILEDSADDRLIPHVVWENLLPRLEDADSVKTLADLIENEEALRTPALALLMPRVVETVAPEAAIRPDDVARLVSMSVGPKMGSDDTRRQTLKNLTELVRQHRLKDGRLARVRDLLTPMIKDGLSRPDGPLHDGFAALAASWGDAKALDLMRTRFASRDQKPEARLQALALLVAARDESALDAVARVVRNHAVSRDFRGRAIASLGGLDSPRVAKNLLRAYPDLEPSLQPRVVELLTQRPVWSQALLDSVESKAVPASAVSVNSLRRLQGSSNQKLAERAKALFGSVREGRDEKRRLVVLQMQNFLRKTPGNPVAGQKVFGKLCAQCHSIYGEGEDVGPDITGNGRNDFDQLVSNVFDPNLVIGAGYQSTTVAIDDGRVLTGLLAEDSADRIVLKIQGGKTETIPRDQVEEMQTSSVSLMPEDVETQLTPREIADLFAYLALDKPPSDPSARLLPGAPKPEQ